MSAQTERSTAAGRVIKNLFLIAVSVATLYPVLWVFKMALTPSQGFDMSLNPIPSEPSLDNFRHLFTELPFFTWLMNSAIVSVATTIIGVFLACTSAYALSRFRFPGRTTAMLAFLVTQMFPGVLMMIPLYLIIDA
ncbi:MAG: sugar ABC transporter permease, partial [Myxococcales bacterium]|nr:sugar ABC transporter permease [Myxococcales bacterium]